MFCHKSIKTGGTTRSKPCYMYLRSMVSVMTLLHVVLQRDAYLSSTARTASVQPSLSHWLPSSENLLVKCSLRGFILMSSVVELPRFTPLTRFQNCFTFFDLYIRVKCCVTRWTLVLLARRQAALYAFFVAF